MRLNTLKPARGAKKAAVRVGRGTGCGFGKTCGRGHKGQHSRAGGFHKLGFEGGQMPLQRRLPKIGFTSRIGRVTAEVRLSELNLVVSDTVDLAALHAADLIRQDVKRAKVVLSGKLEKALTIVGLRVTAGAKAAIEAAGGKVVEA